jgi:uncharacterized protein (TIGR00730 family)
VYGGGHVGLMGILADAARAAGGQVIGVIPQALADLGVAHHDLSELRVVGSMHERKALMASLADGFIALPGGIGTLEEFFEVWTWGQLGLHLKPYGLLDTAGFYRQLLAFLDNLVEHRFLRREHRALLQVAGDPGELLERMATVHLAPVPKWLPSAANCP